jgi:hypothetical protein
MRKEGWVPVPSFIITGYLPVSNACTLLPLILYYQNMRKLNFCWASALELSLRVGWFTPSRNRIYAALSLLSNEKKWKKLGNGLPLPFSIARAPGSKPDTWNRHYRVRAVSYDPKNKKGPHELYLAKEFSQFFKIGAEFGRASD